MFGANSGLFWGVFFALLLFGVGYNAFVDWAERHGYTEGYVSLLVVLGVTVTLLGAAVLDFKAALLVGLLFIASGLPMVVGSVIRYVKRRETSMRSLRAEVQREEEDKETGVTYAMGFPLDIESDEEWDDDD